jgi:hypothetical protein
LYYFHRGKRVFGIYAVRKDYFEKDEFKFNSLDEKSFLKTIKKVMSELKII